MSVPGPEMVVRKGTYLVNQSLDGNGGVGPGGVGIDVGSVAAPSLEACHVVDALDHHSTTR